MSRRILITDSFSSSNRGDAAILDGILVGLAERLPGAEIRVLSRFPEACERFHGVAARPSAAEDPAGAAAEIAAADLVVSCGGSFLTDLYRADLPPRLATFALARRLGVPMVVFGQSIGPFAAPLSRLAARTALDAAAWISVRDPASLREVRELGIRAPVSLGVDAAVPGVPAGPEESRAAAGLPLRVPGPVLGVTVRAWHFPGAPDPAGAQEEYEGAVARAADAFVDATGGQVWFVSTCTAFLGYRQDDRIAARRVRARMRRAESAAVVEVEDLDFARVRGLLASCDLVLGTRMHSLVFATTAGVPAVAVGYEPKCREWMGLLGLPERVVEIGAPAALPRTVVEAWDARGEARRRIARAVAALKEKASRDLDRLAALVRGEAAPMEARPASLPARTFAGWDEEVRRYQVPHRRLRRVADRVLTAPGRTVLDLGAASGLLGALLGPARSYRGFDLSAAAADSSSGRVEPWDLSRGLPCPGERFDTVVASGIVEYLDDVPAFLAAVRERVAPGGVAVITLFNFAHFHRGVMEGLGRGPHRHPDWRHALRPDAFRLRLHAAGLPPVEVTASGLGYGPPPPVDGEGSRAAWPDGAAPWPFPRLVRLAHQIVFVCRPAAPGQGIPAFGEAVTGPLHALRVAAERVRSFPDLACAWGDLAQAFAVVGDARRAAEAAARTALLDPAGDSAREALLHAVLAPDLAARIPGPGDPVEAAERAVLLSPARADAWEGLFHALLAPGRLAAAAEVATLARSLAPAEPPSAGLPRAA